MSLTYELAFMHEVADEAAALAMPCFLRGVSITEKPDSSPVTDADLAVERLIRTRITERFPSDAVVGEEFGTSGVGQRTWIVDPIDGTSYFATGNPNWRIHIALQLDERIELAVVVSPAPGWRWWAQRGAGSYESTWPTDIGAARRLRVSNASELDRSLVACFPSSSRERLPLTCGVAPPSPLPLVELVRGEIDGFVAEGFHLWDHAPWILLVEEAGGRFTDREGSNSGARGGGVYSNNLLHDGLVASLGYGGES